MMMYAHLSSYRWTYLPHSAEDKAFSVEWDPERRLALYLPRKVLSYQAFYAKYPPDEEPKWNPWGDLWRFLTAKVD